MNLKHIITKIHKSKTLIFNWAVSIFAIFVEVSLQFAPEIKTQIPADYYLYFIFFVTMANKLLRAKTNQGLEDK